MNNAAPRIMVNGVFTPDVNVMDRGFQYGDGLFETMLIYKQKIPLWSHHWQRLKKGCGKLSIQIPDKKELESQIKELSKDISEGILKLMVTRGIGNRGYAITGKLKSEVVFIQTDYPAYPGVNWQQGVNVRICETRLAHQPALAGIKHMNRLEQVLARNEWNDTGITEGLMLDRQGNVIEGTVSNLFMVKNDAVYTPELTLCGVAGVMRETVLTILSEENIPCEISNISQAMLLAADEVFLTNSIFGLWPVKKINDSVYSFGPVSQHIQEKVNTLLKNA